MISDPIIIEKVGNFYGVYPVNFYFYMKIVGDITNVYHVPRNIGILFANVLLHNNQYINQIYDAHTGMLINDMVGEKFQNFRKWLER